MAARVLRSIPPSLGGPAIRLLDFGRTARLASPAQRRALALRDRGCVFRGCGRPPAWCETHHWRRPWSAGGRTDLDDLCLLCSFHHHLVHDDGWTLGRDEGGAWTTAPPPDDWGPAAAARAAAAAATRYLDTELDHLEGLTAGSAASPSTRCVPPGREAC